MHDDDARAFIADRLGELTGTDLAAAHRAAPWAWRWCKADDPTLTMLDFMAWNAADPDLFVWPC